MFVWLLIQDQLAAVGDGVRRCLWSKSLNHYIPVVEIISIGANCLWERGEEIMKIYLKCLRCIKINCRRKHLRAHTHTLTYVSCNCDELLLKRSTFKNVESVAHTFIYSLLDWWTTKFVKSRNYFNMPMKENCFCCGHYLAGSITVELMTVDNKIYVLFCCFCPFYRSSNHWNFLQHVEIVN